MFGENIVSIRECLLYFNEVRLPAVFGGKLIPAVVAWRCIKGDGRICRSRMLVSTASILLHFRARWQYR